MNEDVFAQMREAQQRDEQRAEPGTQSAAQTAANTPPAETSSISPAPPPTPAPTPAQARSNARDILLGIYVDRDLADFLDRFTEKRIPGTRRKPTISLVGYWMLSLAREALANDANAAVPIEVARKRRSSE